MSSAAVLRDVLMTAASFSRCTVLRHSPVYCTVYVFKPKRVLTNVQHRTSEVPPRDKSWEVLTVTLINLCSVIYMEALLLVTIVKLNAFARQSFSRRCFYRLEVSSIVGVCQTADLRLGSVRTIHIRMTRQQLAQAQDDTVSGACAFSILPLSSSLPAAVPSVVHSSKSLLYLLNHEENANAKASRSNSSVLLKLAQFVSLYIAAIFQAKIVF